MKWPMVSLTRPIANWTPEKKGSKNVQNLRVQIGQKDSEKDQSQKEQSQESIDTHARLTM